MASDRLGSAAVQHAARALYDYLAEKPWLGSLDPDASGDLTTCTLVVVQVIAALNEYGALAVLKEFDAAQTADDPHPAVSGQS
jgi:hypothetical protein